jgi:hypothetical protein
LRYCKVANFDSKAYWHGWLGPVSTFSSSLNPDFDYQFSCNGFGLCSHASVDRD